MAVSLSVFLQCRCFCRFRHLHFSLDRSLELPSTFPALSITGLRVDLGVSVLPGPCSQGCEFLGRAGTVPLQSASLSVSLSPHCLPTSRLPWSPGHSSLHTIIPGFSASSPCSGHTRISHLADGPRKVEGWRLPSHGGLCPPAVSCLLLEISVTGWRRG